MPLHAETLQKPLLLIGTEDNCLDFLEWLYSILLFHVRETLPFDTYSYETRLDFRIVCLPPEQEYQENIPCSMRFDLMSVQASIHFEATESTERAQLITQKILSGKIQELNRLYVFEEQIEHGKYANLKDDYPKLSLQDQDALFAHHKKAIFLYIAENSDTELLGMIQERITTIEDLTLLGSSTTVLQKFVSDNEVKIIELIEAWSDSNGESGLRQLQKSEEKQLVQGLYQAFESLPDTEHEDTKLLRWYIQHELQHRDHLMRQIFERDLNQLSVERQRRFIRSLVYDVTRIETSEQQERQLNTILEQVFDHSSTKQVFFELMSSFQQANFSKLSDRLVWIIENGTEQKVAEVERLWELERCSKEDPYADLKSHYTAVAPKVKEIFLSSHKTELLSRIVQHKDVEFLKAMQELISSVADIAILAQSVDLLRNLLTQNEEQHAPLIAEWLLLQKEATEMYPLLFEFPALWRAFFRTLRSQPQRIHVLLVPLRFLQKEYRQDYENMLLEKMPELIPHIKAEQGLTDEVFTALTNFPDSCPEQQRMLRALMAYKLSEAPYLLEELLQYNLFEMDGRYHTFILDSLMKGILHTGTPEKREHALEHLFTHAGTHQGRLFTVSKSVKEHGLKSASPRIALITDMAAKGDISGLNTLYALEHSITQEDFSRLKAEYSRIDPAIQECILTSHKKSLLHYLASHSDQELLRILQKKITKVEDIAILSASPDMLRSFVSGAGDRVTSLFLDNRHYRK